MRTRGDRDVYPQLQAISSRQGMGQYDDDECTLPMCFHHNAAKHGYDHFDAVNRTWIHLKEERLVICAPKFIIDHTIEDAPVCDAVSKVAAAMV
ncbi:hypothetical protein TNCV_4932181 [Trichonephila clavipes]|nr:hypothetical protein TNCV_4932181 [Trichonephila clavipes]